MATTMPGATAARFEELKSPISIAIYQNYADAQRAVDYLADNNFPVEKLAIVGTDLKSVERITGRLTWGRVIGAALINSLVWAIGFALLMTLLFSTPFWGSFVWAITVFAILNVVTAAMAYGMTRGERDFTSTHKIVASRYEVLGEREVADQARSLMAGNSTTANATGMPVAQAEPHPPAEQPQQPNYGGLSGGQVGPNDGIGSAPNDWPAPRQ